MVGSAEQSKGGVTTVLKILKTCSLWSEYHCYWLGTQIQGNKFKKIYYCLKSYFTAFIIIPRFDIIHFHTVPDISLVVQLPVLLLAILWQKKIILQLHVGNQIPRHKGEKLFQFYMKHSNLILVLAKVWKDRYNIWFPENKTPVDYLYNAYEPVQVIDYKKRKKTIVYAAHLNTNKAYDVLLKGFRRIANLYPDWKLTIMGDGEITKAQNLAMQLGIANQVEFTGHIIGEQKVKIFQYASIFCLTSYQEGFPMVILEAWGYGIPTITTPVGGLPDVLEEKKNACIFNFGNDEELATKLELLIKDENLRQSMSDYSKRFVESHFSKTIINKKLSSIYDCI